MPPPAQIPDMHLMSIFTAYQEIGLHAVLHHVRCAPFAAEQCVEPEVPPKIVMQKLTAAVDFPLTEDFERLAIEHENAAGPLAVGISERANVNGFRPTVNRVRARIIRARENFLWLDHFYDLWFSRVGLRIDDVNPGGPGPRHDQVTTFDVRMRRDRTQRRTDWITRQV